MAASSSSSPKRRRAAAAAGKGGDAGTSAPAAAAAAAAAASAKTSAAAAAAAAVAHDASKLPSLSEIKGALPKECFSASTELSLYYALRDAVMMAVLLASGRWLWTSGGGAAVFFCGAASEAAGGGGVCGQLAAGVVWPLYWLVLGTVMWGVFVVGHDCGHGSFSRYRWLNTVVGSVMHSSILTPYMPWRRTHRQHHKHTGNMDRDEIFQPIRRRRAASPFWRYSRNFGPALFGLGAAWFMYLIFGFAPRNLLGYHFWPLTLPSTERVRLANSAAAARELIVSHGCYLAMLFGLWQWARADGWTAVAVLYGAPLFVFATWLVVVTFLHHNQRLTIPWASNRTWTYVSGQLSTVDRSYGALLDNITHHIGTHQIHHLFPAIPHYRLQTATRAFRKAYPHLVRTSDEPIPVAFVRNARHYDKNAVVDDTVDSVIM